MAEGRNRRMWDHTSLVAACAWSAFRSKLFDPAKLNPYTAKSAGRATGIPITAANIGLLKTVFVKDVDGSPRDRNEKERGT